MKAVHAAILAAVCLLASTPAFARVGVNIYLTPPPVVVAPAPAPQVVVPAPPPQEMVPAPPPAYAAPYPMVEYRYYPGWNVYLDPFSGLFWSFQYGRWVLGPLPRHIHPGRLGGYVVVPAERGRPWHHAQRGYYGHR